MALKVATLLAVLACASAQLYNLRPGAYPRPYSGYRPAPIAYQAAAPIAYQAVAPIAYQARAPLALRREDDEYDANPQYQFSYSVDDALTGDSKSQTESRQGDNVQGSYSLVEADGSRRVVEYTADAVNGFNAVVHKEAGGGRIAAAPVQVAYRAAPAPIAYQAPIAYAQPRPILRTAAAAPAIVSTSFSSPIASYAF